MSICIPSLVYSVGHKILKPICMTLSCSTRDISHKFLNPREREVLPFTYVRNYDHTLQLAKKHGKFRLDTKHPSHTILILVYSCLSLSQGVWYMHLKTENMCLKICVKIHVGGKMCRNTYNVI